MTVPLEYAKVVGRLGLHVGDRPSDVDLAPNVIWCDSGIVRFTPLLGEVQVTAAVDDGPYLLSESPIDAVVGSDGRLYYPDEASGNAFVNLPDLTSELVNPHAAGNKATHKVEFIGIQAEGKPVKFATRYLRFTSDTVLNDITLLSPVSSTGSGVGISRGIGIVGAEIINGNELLLTMEDGSTVNAGEVPTPFLVTWDGVAYEDRPGVDTVLFVGPENPDTLGLMEIGDAWINTDPDAMPDPELLYLVKADLPGLIATPADPIAVALGEAAGTTGHPLNTELITAIAGSVADLTATVYDTEHADLEAALDALSDYGTLQIAGTHTRATAFVVDKPCVIEFVQGGKITGTSTSDNGIEITSDYVTVVNPSLTGPAYVALGAATAIYAAGTLADPLTNIAVIGTGTRATFINRWAFNGVYFRFVNGFTVANLVMDDLAYAGFLTVSCTDGKVTGNRISNITQPGGIENGYGISLNRDSTTLALSPRSARIVVTHNLVTGVPNWEGIDTHAGEDITIASNVVLGCKHGIVATQSSDGTNPLLAPKRVSITGNVIDSQLTNGTAGQGIQVVGAEIAATPSVPMEYAEGVSVIGNTVKGYGTESSTIQGAVFARDTRGLVISANTLIESAPYSICLLMNNVGFAVTGNALVDSWSSSSSGPAGIVFRQSYNKGYVGGNVVRAGSKSATYLNVNGILGLTATGTDVVLGPNDLTAATTKLSTSGGIAQRSDVPYLAPNGQVDAPSFAFANDPDNGFYRQAADQWALVVAGTARIVFYNPNMDIANGFNIAFGTGSGSYIGTGPSQVFAFWGGTKGPQPAAVADATDAASAITQLNALLARLRSRGIIAT